MVLKAFQSQDRTQIVSTNKCEARSVVPSLIALAAGGALGVLAYRQWCRSSACDFDQIAEYEIELEDVVDVASADSIPASDPPAYTSGRRG